MSRRMSLATLGCSAIADNRALPAVGLVPDIALAAVASRSPEKAARFAEKYGTKAMTYDEVLEDPTIEAVYLSLPTGLHHEWTARALRAGKHVLCEKPLTTCIDQARELTGLAVERGLVLRENFTFLHHPQHTSVRSLLADGRFGAVRTFTASFGIPPLPASDIRYNAELGGGALLDLGVYPIRAAQFLLGDNLTVVGAVLRTDEATGLDLAGHVLLVSDNDVFADLEFGFQHAYRSRYAMWGSAATLTLDRAFTPPPQRQPLLRIDEQDHAEEIVLPAAHQFRSSFASFAEAVLQGWRQSEEQPWLRGAEETARLIDRIRREAVQVPVRGQVPVR
ncbi:Gfo/Idh/MocA family protein [Prauserella cavernicola]|uniref:Gfo/Idh/MocA family oxidoreductase n=1 Tax=Prauserella cavernicola TaxID=2800127 RepID=A0A934V6V0_9PSEU|nr:Gfo/Idh/MocA family oxidoreductase [Prauserella cavernicola]MBK1786595.1 Gfo/Idh/MocA family oxidoreductase [Prauserella cavernicola]